jgi:hypothetical protein
MIRLEENKKSIPLTRFVSNFFKTKKERNNSAPKYPLYLRTYLLPDKLSFPQYYTHRINIA